MSNIDIILKKLATTKKVKLNKLDSIVSQTLEHRDEVSSLITEVGEKLAEVGEIASELNDTYSKMEEDYNALLEIEMALVDLGVDNPPDLDEALQYAKNFLNADFRVLLNNIEAAHHIIDTLPII